MKKIKKTPLIKVNGLLIKDESKNPFGTVKDRRSKFIIESAQDSEVDKLAIVTSGNAGYSLVQFAKGTEIKVVSIVDKGLKKSIKDKLKKSCYKLIELDLSKEILKPEKLIAITRESNMEVIWDVTNDFPGAYISIISEIEKEKPNFLVVPIGGGELFVGLNKGIKKFGLKTKLIGVSPLRKRDSFADKLPSLWSPYELRIKSILKQGHKNIKLNEDEIKGAYNKFKDTVDCEPSSAIVFGIVDKLKFKEKDKVIFLNTGKGIW